MELICALVLLDRNIEKINDLSNIVKYKTIYDHKIKFNSVKDFPEYMKDIFRKEKIIKNYITTFKKSLEHITSLSADNIQIVYITGKINKHSEIDELNSGLCKLEAKSDIYIKQKK